MSQSFSRRPVRAGLVAVAAAALALTVPFSPAVADDSATACIADDHVWVVVEHDAGLSQGCATKFATGFEALTSAGIEYTESGGFVATVDGQPAAAGPEDWWSYWSATPAADGAIAEWTSYTVGAAESRPQAGTVEGWRLAHSFTEDAPAPSLTSLAGTPAATPQPTATTAPAESPTLPKSGV